MVICKYFQNGNCRFGTKCLNEHFDVKASIKSEIEAALKGNQWPLSCFGPFKEKPCIPNFIEDQSFEEIRHLCYEAKKQNCFPAFHQQYNQMVLNAKSKMNALLTLNRDVVDLVTNLYNSTTETKVNDAMAKQQNPFFSASSGMATNQTQTNLFGNTMASPITQQNPFSTVSSNSIFGGASSALNTNINSIFGGANTNANSNFATSTTNTFVGNQQSGANLFSQQSQSSMFGVGNATGGTQQIFGGTSNTPGFGTANQTTVFGQTPHQQQISGGNLFTQQQSTFSFAQNQPQQQQQQASIFGGGSVQQSIATSGYGSSLFSQQPQQQNQNTFGSSQQQQQNVLGGNLFSTATQQSAQPVNLSVSAFGSPSQNPQQIPQQQNFTGNLFGQVAQKPEQQQQQVVTLGGTGFGGFNQQQSVIIVSETVYSKMDDLKPEEIEAFKADTFVLGKIPTNPPPRELVQFTH